LKSLVGRKSPSFDWNYTWDLPPRKGAASPIPTSLCLSFSFSSAVIYDETRRSGDNGDDEESQCSSEIEPFDHFQARILYHFSRIITATNPPLIIPRKGGGFNHIIELSVAGAHTNHAPTMRYIWRSPRIPGPRWSTV